MAPGSLTHNSNTMAAANFDGDNFSANYFRRGTPQCKLARNKRHPMKHDEITTQYTLIKRK